MYVYNIYIYTMYVYNGKRVEQFKVVLCSQTESCNSDEENSEGVVGS